MLVSPPSRSATTWSAVFARRIAVALACTVACGGCQWIAELEMDPNTLVAIREIEKPALLDQPFDDSVDLYRIAHRRQAQALVARLEELGAGLEDADLRSAYAASLAAGEPSRAKAYAKLSVERAIDPEDAGQLLAAWERVDDALALGEEPELNVERLYALSAFVRDFDPSAPSRLTEAIRDDWSPDSEAWHEAIAAIENPSDRSWDVAWTAAQKRDLDDVRGRAILEAMSWIDVPPGVHPFASPRNLEWLCDRISESRDEDELLHVSGQFRSLDPASSDRLFQAAQKRPLGAERLSSAFEAYRRTKNESALAELQSAVADEPIAYRAIDYLSRCGKLDTVELPTGETLARAKAYFAVDHYFGFLDDEIRQATLTLLVSGKAACEGEEIETSVFRYSLPRELERVSEIDASGDGLAIVDDGMSLSPDETSAPAVDPNVESSPEFVEPELAPSFQQSYETGALATLRDEGCRTFLDLIAAVGLPDTRRNDDVAFGRDDLLKEKLLAEDERWKVFDVPFESVGFVIPVDDETPADSDVTGASE